jgi:hypothetical protein
MFLTPEQIEQLQALCEDVAGRRTRNGKVTIDIYNNMPRSFEVTIPVIDENHVLIGFTTRIIRCALPEEELKKKRQKNRMKPKKEDV